MMLQNEVRSYPDLNDSSWALREVATHIELAKIEQNRPKHFLVRPTTSLDNISQQKVYGPVLTMEEHNLISLVIVRLFRPNARIQRHKMLKAFFVFKIICAISYHQHAAKMFSILKVSQLLKNIQKVILCIWIAKTII